MVRFPRSGKTTVYALLPAQFIAKTKNRGTTLYTSFLPKKSM